MDAITLWQPWATLVVMGHKKFETRNRRTHVRGTVAIHAAKYRKIPHYIYITIANAVGISEKDYPGSWLHSLELGEPQELFGSALGTVDITGAISTAYVKTHSIVPEKEYALGDYSDGRWAWGLKNPVQYNYPIPAQGHQGFWKWMPPTEAGILNTAPL